MRVFIDFDNTVTLGDVLSQLIKEFSINEDWRVLEDAWQGGEITTKECLTGQMKYVRIYPNEILSFLKKVKIDPYFSKLIDLLREKKVEFAILSDNFEVIIKEILFYHQISEIPIYANQLTIYRNRLLPSFPYQNPNCFSCAHCKKIHFVNEVHSLEDPIIYIGDGKSDICPAKEADIVLAKDVLLKYFRKNELPCIEFRNLAKVYDYLNEGLLGWCPSKELSLVKGLK